MGHSPWRFLVDIGSDPAWYSEPSWDSSSLLDPFGYRCTKHLQRPCRCWAMVVSEPKFLLRSSLHSHWDKVRRWLRVSVPELLRRHTYCFPGNPWGHFFSRAETPPWSTLVIGHPEWEDMYRESLWCYPMSLIQGKGCRSYSPWLVRLQGKLTSEPLHNWPLLYQSLLPHLEEPYKNPKESPRIYCSQQCRQEF